MKDFCSMERDVKAALDAVKFTKEEAAKQHTNEISLTDIFDDKVAELKDGDMPHQGQGI